MCRIIHLSSGCHPTCYPDWRVVMKIKSVRSFLLSYPFPEPIRLPFWGGERTILKRDAMFVRIEADNGLVGYAPGAGSEEAHQAIERVIAPFLVDRVLAAIPCASGSDR